MNEILNILGSLGFNWHVALANFVNFLIILFLLNKFFFGKIGKTIDERHEIIERGLSQASDAEKALAQAELQKAEILKEAKKESGAIITEAHKEAETMGAQMKAETDADIASRLAALATKEAQVQDSVEKEFALRAPALVAELYRKTLAKEMTEVENNAFIARVK